MKKPLPFGQRLHRSAEREGLPKTAFPEGGGFEDKAVLAALAAAFSFLDLHPSKLGSTRIEKAGPPKGGHGLIFGGEGGIGCAFP